MDTYAGICNGAHGQEGDQIGPHHPSALNQTSSGARAEPRYSFRCDEPPLWRRSCLT